HDQLITVAEILNALIESGTPCPAASRNFLLKKPVNPTGGKKCLSLTIRRLVQRRHSDISDTLPRDTFHFHALSVVQSYWLNTTDVRKFKKRLSATALKGS